MAIINHNSISGINTISVGSSIVIGDNFVLNANGIENVNGLNISGVVTASSFVGDGSSLTGIDATALKDPDGNVIIQAEASGINVTGVSTFSDEVYFGASAKATSGGGNFTLEGNIGNSAGTYLRGATVYIGANGGSGSYSNTVVVREASGNQLVELAYAGSTKLATTAGGIDVTGHAELDNVNISGVLTATSAEFSGNVTVLGDLTYENVTNLDSVGVATARSGLRITGGGLDVVGVSTFNNDLSIADKIIHTGDTDTSIRFPAADTFTVETAGGERLRVTSDGKLGLNYNNPTTIIHAIGNNTVGTSVTCKLQSHDTPNATANLELLARDSSNNNETCRIRAASEGTTNVDLQFHTNNTEKLRITSSGEVRISNTDITASTSADELIIGPNIPAGDRGITIFSGTSGTGNIFFGDTDTSGVGNRMGTITYDHSGNFMRFSTNGNNERLRITSSGAIGIGTVSPEQPNVAGMHIHSTNNDDCRIAFSTPNKPSSRIGYYGLSNNFGIDVQNGFQIRDAADSNATRLYIDSSGNFNVGTTTILGKAHFAGNSSNRTLVVTDDGTSNTTRTYDLLRGYGYKIGTTMYGQAAVQSTYNSASNRSELVFLTSTGGASAGTEYLRLNSYGAIGLSGENYGTSGQVLTSQGTTSAPQWSSPATPNNGTLTINQGGSSKGTFTANQSGNTTVNLDAGNATGLGMDKYVIFNDSGTILSSSNISSVSRTNAGRYTINFSGSFSNVNYLILSTGRNYSTDQNERSLTIYSMSTGSCNVALVANNNGGPNDNGGHVAFYGT